MKSEFAPSEKRSLVARRRFWFVLVGMVLIALLACLLVGLLVLNLVVSNLFGF